MRPQLIQAGARLHMGQFSVTILAAAGSVTIGNQYFTRLELLEFPLDLYMACLVTLEAKRTTCPELNSQTSSSAMRWPRSRIAAIRCAGWPNDWASAPSRSTLGRSCFRGPQRWSKKGMRRPTKAAPEAASDARDGFEPGKKTVQGTVFPANGGILKNRHGPRVACAR